MSHSPQRLTTRSLMACAVLGAASAVFVWLSIALNSLMSASVPWLAYPAPVPIFFGAIVAVLLIRKPGVASLTGFVAALVGFGAMALLAGLFVELAAFVGSGLLSGRHDLFGSRTLAWAALAGGMGGLSQGMGIFMVAAAREATPLHLILLGMLVKVIVGIAYGLISHAIARAVFHSGVNPQAITVPAR